VFDVLSLLPKTVKCPHFGSPTFPGTDCLVCPWPVPLGYQLEGFLGPTFLRSALSYILQTFLCGPPAYHCWLQPSASYRLPTLTYAVCNQPSCLSVASCSLCVTAAARA
jgi:hypothetical protein